MEQVVITPQSPGVFFWLLYFIGITFYTKIPNSTLQSIIAPQVNHELTYCRVYEGHALEESDQD